MTKQEALDLIYRKGLEYFDCAAHLHVRGMLEIMKEIHIICVEGSAADFGLTFYDVHKYFEEKAGCQIEVANDTFLKTVKLGFT